MTERKVQAQKKPLTDADLQAALADYLTTVQIAAAYAPIVHTHSISAIAGLQTALDGKASSTHVHGNISNSGTIGSTANLPLITTTGGAITVGAFGSAANTFCQGNDFRLSDARTPTSHVHGNVTNAGAIGSTSGLPIITGASGVLQVGSFGATSGTFAAGDDSRLVALTNLRPAISDQPDSQFYEISDTVGFSVVAATIANTHLSISYQWQISTDNGGSWSNIGGATSSTFTTGTLSATEKNYRYRCLVTNQFGTETSTSAILSLGLLDEFPVAAAAYSLRRLSKSFSGAVVRVRRSSDSAEANFTADEVSNGTLLSWVGVGNSAFVTTWFDQEGSNNAVQTTAANQPRIVNAGVLELNDKGFPCLRFIDSSSGLLGPCLVISTFHLSTDTWIACLAVYSLNDNGGFPYIFGSSPADRGILLLHNSNTRRVRNAIVRTGGVPFSDGSTLAAGRSYVRLDIADRSTLRTFLNSTATSDTSTADRNENVNMPSSYWIGSNDSTTHLIDSSITEVVLFNSDASASQQAIRNRIVADYNITV